MKIPRVRAGSVLRSFLAPLLFLSLLFFSHCDPDEGYQHVYPISEETKDYCYFKEGSWWVYVDSNKMVYDTVECLESVMEDVYDASVMKYPIQEFSSLYRSKYSNLDYRVFGPSYLFDTLVIQHAARLTAPPNYHYYVLFFESNSIDSLVYNSSVITRREGVLGHPKFKNGITFISNTSSSLPNELPMISSWVLNVGIVYKSMPDGTNWQLIDYHIVQ